MDSLAEGKLLSKGDGVSWISFVMAIGGMGVSEAGRAKAVVVAHRGTNTTLNWFRLYRPPLKAVKK